MGEPGVAGGLYEPGDDVGRAWDEAEAILLACEDLDAVMETIRGAESPVEARRALKLGFGFTGRQAALLLTLPVLSFTRSERSRIHENRRARMDLLADVTGTIPAVPTAVPGAEPDAELAEPIGVRPSRRSRARREEGPDVVLDEQIGELCDAIAALLGAEETPGAWLDDPREPGSPTGTLLDGCGVDDSTGIRTLLWHLYRTGLDSVEGLFPFSEPLRPDRALEVQVARVDRAMATGGLGSEPGGQARWAGRLWPIAERQGYGYAVSYGTVSGAGSIWAYGGDEPLHRMWDSVVDLLIELYRAFAEGEPCDAALAVVSGGRVAWTNLS